MHNLIVPYRFEWKIQFENLKEVYKATLRDFDCHIEQVGSTAIEGMMAKPILDIDIVIHEKQDLKSVAEHLESLGYTGRGDLGIKGRYAFRQKTPLVPITIPANDWPEHHLYVCFSDSLALKNHLLFRDSILNDQDLFNQYLNLKLDLVNNPFMNRQTYGRLKTEFILSVLKKAGLTDQEVQEIRLANI